MKRVQAVCIVLILAGLLAAPVQAQDLIVFPAKGQSNEQMEREKFECYSWAKGQTGFDPMQTPTATSPPPSQQQKSVGGSALRGGAVGAAGGAALGAITGKGAGKGAAVGGLAGGAFGGIRSSRQNRRARQQQEQQEQQQANQYMQRRNTYNRAYAACLEGKGYTVK